MSTSVPKRTIFCPTGCHEDYLERETIDGENGDIFGTRYTCYRCGWVARWDNQEGFKVLVDVDDDRPNIFSDDEQWW